jgi:hypothetical protein
LANRAYFAATISDRGDDFFDQELCQLAAAEHGLRTLRAATAEQNAASRKVLIKAGFVPVGPADLGSSIASSTPSRQFCRWSRCGRTGRSLEVTTSPGAATST